MKSKLSAIALSTSSAVVAGLMTVSQAFATGSYTPPAAPAPSVPEINGPGALAVIALLVSLGVVFYNKVRK
jgi:hypothetical protein